MAETELEQRNKRLEHWAEVGSAVLLAVATVLSAWCAYQAVRWDGVQIANMGKASAYRMEATNLYDRANRKVIVQSQLFVNYLDARSKGNTALADYLSGRFPSPLKEAFHSWIALNPTAQVSTNSPFELKEYHLKEVDQANRLIRKAEEVTRQATYANQMSDKYTLLTVIFAFVLFFGGIATKFSLPSIQIGFVVAGWVILIFTAIIMARFPVQ